MEVSSGFFDEQRVDAHGCDQGEAEAGKNEIKHDGLLSFQEKPMRPKTIRVRLGRSAAGIRIL
jgi:hypothetical protein